MKGPPPPRRPPPSHHEQTVITSPGVVSFDRKESAPEDPSAGWTDPELRAKPGPPVPTQPGVPARRGGPRPWVPRNLPKISRAQALMGERLQWLMPAANADREVTEAVCQRLAELLEDTVTLTVDHTHVVSPAELKRLIAEPAFLAILAPSPQRARGLLEVDLSLCHASIDKLLGGTGDASALRSLTDIEEGVMGYVILECLKTLAPNLDAGLPRPRLEGTARSVEAAIALFGEEPNVAIVQLKATLGAQAGFVRLFIPQSVVGMTNAPGEGPERKARWQAQLVRGLGRLKTVETQLRAEIGRAVISGKDLSGIRSGDVVLLDELTARPDKGEGGVVKLRIGRGARGRLVADLLEEDGRYKARITGFEPGEEARRAENDGVEQDGEAQRADASAAGSEPGGTQDEEAASRDSGGEVSENEQGGEGADLLADIPLQIAVEIGRVAVTADQVVAMKPGQVIDLNKLPGEPVELSVNGKIVGRGELVDIEGHLGVKVLSTVG